MQNKFTLLGIVLLCAGCATHPVAQENSFPASLPSWISSVEKSTTIYGVGSCGVHVEGKEAQKKLALLRAIDNLSLQYNVHVKTAQYAVQQGDKNSYSSTLLTQSEHHVDTSIKAVIVDTWDDTFNGMYYVRVKAE